MDILTFIVNGIAKVCKYIWELAKFIGCLSFCLLVVGVLCVISVFRPDLKCFRDELWDKLCKAISGV